MTNQQILEKAVQKAIQNGWQGGKELNTAGDWMGDPPKIQVIAPFSPKMPRIMYTTGGVDTGVEYYPPVVLLYDHEFAKALWDKPIPNTNAYNSYELNGKDIDEWQYHLAEMVIAEDPIRYLGNNI